MEMQPGKASLLPFVDERAPREGVGVGGSKGTGDRGAGDRGEGRGEAYKDGHTWHMHAHDEGQQPAGVLPLSRVIPPDRTQANLAGWKWHPQSAPVLAGDLGALLKTPRLVF